jgi:hypothetical protein
MKKLSDFLRELPDRALVVVDTHFPEVAVEALNSVKFGSILTGAPGQPVDTATLLNSWILEFLTKYRARISTPLEYAEPVEDAVGPHGAVAYGRKNNIGGSHSMALTIMHLQNIADAVAARMKDGGAGGGVLSDPTPEGA